MSEATKRKQFEAWISGPPYERLVERFPNDPAKYAWPRSYKDIATELAWEAWQEATKEIVIQ